MMSPDILVDLQGKIAFPFVIIIMVFIGVSFSLRSERSGGVMQSVGIGIFIGFSYWIVHAFSMSLGLSGILSGISCRLGGKYIIQRRCRFTFL